MSEQKHTPGPWHADSIDQVRAKNGMIVARCERKERHEYMPCEEQSANARRIAACVNACEGLEDPQNFRDALNAQSKRRDALRARGVELTQQRDELRAELARLIRLIEVEDAHLANFGGVEAARALIAKVQP